MKRRTCFIEVRYPSRREIRVPILLVSEGARNSIASEGVWEYLNILKGFWSWEALEFLATINCRFTFHHDVNRHWLPFASFRRLNWPEWSELSWPIDLKKPFDYFEYLSDNKNWNRNKRFGRHLDSEFAIAPSALLKSKEARLRDADLSRVTQPARNRRSSERIACENQNQKKNQSRIEWIELKPNETSAKYRINAPFISLSSNELKWILRTNNWLKQ